MLAGLPPCPMNVDIQRGLAAPGVKFLKKSLPLLVWHAMDVCECKKAGSIYIVTLYGIGHDYATVRRKRHAFTGY